MTPDELRALAGEAWEWRAKRTTAQSAQRAHRWLERHDIDLARLCAELAEALRESADWLEGMSSNPYGRNLIPIREADAVLAKLAELDAR